MFDLGSLMIAGFLSAEVPQAKPLNWQQLPLFSLPHSPEAETKKTLETYLDTLSPSQGVLFVSDWWTFAEKRPTIPHAAASLTKLATTLAALEHYGTDHRFQTIVKKRGEIREGKLEGDLIIAGGSDPFFVWEEAIALGNALNELGIETVSGDLMVTGNFFMNYQQEVTQSANLLTQALASPSWSSTIERQYEKMPPETPRPQIEIRGETVVKSSTEKGDILLRHQSLPLAEILRAMNIYSNNAMAKLIAKPIGGSEGIEEIVLEAITLPPEEIQLTNASGLGVENQMSPRAVVKLLQQLEEKMAGKGKTIADLLPVTGKGKGTVRDRDLREGLAVKTGSLARISTLAGVIPTQSHGLVYFVIMNQYGNLDTFRQQQDQVLQTLAKEWQILPLEPTTAEK